MLTSSMLTGITRKMKLKENSEEKIVATPISMKKEKNLI